MKKCLPITALAVLCLALPAHANSRRNFLKAVGSAGLFATSAATGSGAAALIDMASDYEPLVLMIHNKSASFSRTALETHLVTIGTIVYSALEEKMISTTSAS